MIRIKNWEKFQHYKDRRPLWIKLYRDLLDDIEWHKLDGESAKCLVMMWLVASESDGELPGVQELAFRLRVSEKLIKSSISKLSHWLEPDDSSMLAEGYQDAILEKEKRREREEKEKEKEGEGVAKKRAATIPKDFELTDEMREFALSIHPDMDTAATFASFKDHHTNHGTLGRDWIAGWRTWVRNGERFGYVRAKKREQRISTGRKISPLEIYGREQNGS